MRWVEDPWRHLESESFLEPHVAAEIATHWPVTGFEWLKHSDVVQPDGTSLRRYQPLSRAFPELALEVIETGERVRGMFETNMLLYPFTWLVEDAPGYRIRSHTDCADKVITCQVYLAEDDAHADHGVVLHTRDRAVRRQVPYRFNYGYAFKVSGHSWHRVERATVSRRSMQLIYYSVPNPHI